MYERAVLRNTGWQYDSVTHAGMRQRGYRQRQSRVQLRRRGLSNTTGKQEERTLEFEVGGPNFRPRKGREALGFESAVRREFAFLDKTGYSVLRNEATFVSYDNGALRINVFHGRGSYAIGVNFEGRDGQRFSLLEILIACKGPGASPEIIAETPEAVASGVRAVAEQVLSVPASLRGEFPVEAIRDYRRALTDYYSGRSSHEPDMGRVE